MKENRFLLPVVLAVLSVTSVATRFYGLENQSLWSDEIYSVVLSRDFGPLEITKAMFDDVHPPAFQLLLAAFIRVFGDSEWAVRLLSAASGALSIPLLYLLGSALYGHREAFLAGALLCISSNAVYYSQEARSFSLLLLLTILSSVFFVKAFFNLPHPETRIRKWHVFYVLSSIVLSYVHYYGILVILAHASTVFACRRRLALRLRDLVKTYLLIAAAFLPWLPAFLIQIHIKKFWISRPTLTSVSDYFIFAFNGDYRLALFGGLLVLISCIVTFTRLNKGSAPGSNNLRFQDFFLGTWILIPISLAFIKSVISTPIFTNRNLIICLPAIYLLVVKSIVVLLDSMFKQWSKRFRTAEILGVSVLLAGISHLHSDNFYSRPNRPQYREPVQIVLSDRMPFLDTFIVATDKWFDYYLEHLARNIRTDAYITNIRRYPKVKDAFLKSGKRHLWFLQGNGSPGDTDVFLAFSQDFKLLKRRRFLVTGASLFEKPGREQ